MGDAHYAARKRGSEVLLGQTGPPPHLNPLDRAGIHNGRRHYGVGVNSLVALQGAAGCNEILSNELLS